MEEPKCGLGGVVGYSTLENTQNKMGGNLKRSWELAFFGAVGGTVGGVGAALRGRGGVREFWQVERAYMSFSFGVLVSVWLYI